MYNFFFGLPLMSFRSMMKIYIFNKKNMLLKLIYVDLHHEHTCFLHVQKLYVKTKTTWEAEKLLHGTCEQQLFSSLAVDLVR